MDASFFRCKCYLSPHLLLRCGGLDMRMNVRTFSVLLYHNEQLSRRSLIKKKEMSKHKHLRAFTFSFIKKNVKCEFKFVRFCLFRVLNGIAQC